MSDKTVLVTGFGPFGEHKINASWQAVQLLPKLDLGGIKIVIEELPVIYSYIDEHVPLMWEKYNPKLVVHVGVSSSVNMLTIETQAFRTGYSREDYGESTCQNGEVCSTNNGKDCIRADLNIDQICSIVGQTTKFNVCKSSSAGRFLCEFTYYTSLNIDADRTLFVHVPPLNEPYSAKELAEGILAIIKAALQQLS